MNSWLLALIISMVAGYSATVLMLQVQQYNELAVMVSFDNSAGWYTSMLIATLISPLAIGLLIFVILEMPLGWERFRRYGPIFTWTNTHERFLLIRFSEHREFQLQRPATTA